MKDKAFLELIHDRLEYFYGESRNADLMHKLRAIIRDTPPDKETPINASNKRVGANKKARKTA